MKTELRLERKNGINYTRVCKVKTELDFKGNGKLWRSFKLKEKNVAFYKNHSHQNKENGLEWSKTPEGDQLMSSYCNNQEERQTVLR